MRTKMTLDNLLEMLDAGARTPEGTVFTPELASRAIFLLSQIQLQLDKNDRLIDLQQKSIARVVRAYRRANQVENGITTDCSAAVDWLLDNGYRARESKLRSVVEKTVSRLDTLGELSIEGKYTLDGIFLIRLRTDLVNALLVTHEPAQTLSCVKNEPAEYQDEDESFNPQAYGQGEIPRLSSSANPPVTTTHPLQPLE